VADSKEGVKVEIKRSRRNNSKPLPPQKKNKAKTYIFHGKWCFCFFFGEVVSRMTLRGGNSNIFYFHPENWGRFPF